jgi:gliding motility-associated-like protein
MRLRKLGGFLFFITAFTCSVSAQNLSNRGKEFWLGYGHNQLFTSQGNTQEMTLYLSAEQAATVTITINGTSYSNTINIPANTVNTSVVLPKSGVNDCRLLNEGLSSRGVHVVSDVPIVAYAHCTGSASSGATLLLPVETYGNTYFSVNSEQRYNNDCYSWFFVIASQNNTVVEITPSAPTRGGRAANSPFTVTLNKGEIYNVMGAIQSGTNGYDLTGSKIKSVANSSGECLPIAVFSGSSRTYICGSGGGDYIIQQIFPASAWGNRYLTSPVVSTTDINTNNPSIYRVAVRDPSTIVKRNGIRLLNIQRNFYYEFTSTSADYIEADKPVLVAQYLVSQGSCGALGVGDPEMFYLSPIEQAISRVGFYNTNKEASTITANTYVNIIVPTAHFASLRVDGGSVFERRYTHPQNPAYTVAIKKLSAPSQHTISCDTGFTAITYGLASVESYGYNAGTLVNNLDAVTTISNTLSQVGTSGYTCPNSPFNFSIKLTYKPTQMVWRFSQVNNIVPNLDTTLVNPPPADSSVINGRKYYEYRLLRDYTFTDTGFFNIPIVVTAPEIDNCNNSTTVIYTARVNAPPKPDFTFTYTGCKSDTAFLFGSFIPNGYNVTRYRWTFDDGTTDSLQDTKKVFPTQGSHNVKLRVISDNGCVGDTVKPVVTSPPPAATFGMTPPGGCSPTTITFTDTSSYAGGPIHNWYWDFGNGVTLNETTNASQTQTYSTPGKYTIKHFAQSGSCRGDTTSKILTIYAKPIVSFDVPLGCLPDSMAQFINTSSVPDSQAITYSWNFGDANATPANPNTSTVTHPLHKYTAYGTYTVTLTTTTANGCVNTMSKPFTIGGFSPAIQYTILSDTSLCVQKPVQLRNEVNVSGDSIYKVVLFWDLVNQPTDSTIDNSPVQNAIYSHAYPVFTSPVTKTFTIKVVVYSRGGCISEKVKQITVHAAPVVSFATLTGMCVNSQPKSVALGTVTNGVTGMPGGLYSGPGTTSIGMFDPAIAGVGIHTIKYVFTSIGGCQDSATQTIEVYPKPVVKWGFRNLCDSTQFRDSSTIASGAINSWNWSFGNNTSSVKMDANPFNIYYGAAATYTVKLFLESDKGCISDTASKPVTISPLPVAAFTVAREDSLCSSKAVMVTNNTLPVNDTITKVEIYWDSINQPTVSQVIIGPVLNAQYTHQYPSFTSPSTKSVTIRWVVYARNGCTTETSKTITLHALPVLSFPVIPSVCISAAPVSIALASAANTTGTGTYSGPGTTAAGVFSPAVAGIGTHAVKFIFSSEGGCVDSITSFIKVLPKPLAKFGFTQVCNGDSTMFSDSSTLTTGSINEWKWVFGDGGTSNRTSSAPFGYVYNSYGNFAASLSVVSDSGCISDVLTKEVTVHALPVTDFGLPTSVCMPGSDARFNNLTTVPNGSISTVSYAWNFGDGSSTSTATNPTHTYAASGSYSIQLTATSAAGCTKDTTKVFSAFYEKPTADFVVSDTSICQGIESRFFDSSFAPSSVVNQWLWSFGDGTTSSLEDPVKTFAAPGLYSVKLSVTTPQGCTADTTKTVRVFLQPVVDAGPNQIIEEGTAIQMQPVVNDTTLNFLWTPSIYLSNATALQPTLRPLFNQTYRLTATGAGNCSAFDTVRITVLKPLLIPNAFSPNGDGINDTWQIPYLVDYPGHVVEVYNRYGQVVYRVVGYSKPWDGTINGKPLPVGVYYYIIDLKKEKYPQITGPLTILK